MPVLAMKQNEREREKTRRDQLATASTYTLQGRNYLT